MNIWENIQEKVQQFAMRSTTIYIVSISRNSDCFQFATTLAYIVQGENFFLRVSLKI